MFYDCFHTTLNKSKEELCGDNVQIIRNPEHTIAVLADGLGSGVKASILSTMTAKIISTLLKERLSIEEAVSTLLLTLPVCKIRNLSYSTFSLVSIDNEGNTYITEFDNPSLILIRNGKHLSLPFEKKSIDGYSVKKSFVRLMPDDEMYLVSDGVIHAGIGTSLSLGWQFENVAKYIEKLQKDKEKSIFEKVLDITGTCYTFYNSQPGDDCSVVGIKAKSERHGVIMIGPPIDKARDAEVVNILMEKGALKAVCGGTAANIVARVTNKQIFPSIEFPDPKVPPTATIDGIDLVTEGVVTLSKALEMLKKVQSGNLHSLNFSSKKDGASSLLKFMLTRCTHIKFLVGMTLNPAHKDFEFENSMIKHKIVEDLVSIVQGFGKIVTVKYY